MSQFKRTNYSGYLLDQAVLLSALAERGITPRHERLFAEHVTYAYPDANCAPAAQRIRVVGYAADEHVDCVKVEVMYDTDDRTDNSIRPDGKVFHCTLSVSENGKPVMSNQLLATGVLNELDPFEIGFLPF